MRQINPETGESIVFFQNTNPIIFVTFVSLFFDLLYQRGYQWQSRLNRIWIKCRSMRQLRPEKGESLANFQNLDPIVFVLFLSLYLLTVSERVPNVILLYIKHNRICLWGSYGLKQGNSLQNIQITNKIVFVLSPAFLIHEEAQ